MARLAGIYIYPIKSLDAISLKEVRLLPSGALADDRRFAFVDALGRCVNGKREPRVHQLRTIYDPAARQLKLWRVQGGAQAAIDDASVVFDIAADRAALQRWLSDYFQYVVHLRENDELGFPDDTDSPGPTLISTATLRTVAEWFDLSLEQARARFRANLEIDDVPPFWEDRLFGARGTTVRFRFRDVVFDGINPCQRCVVPARDARTGQDTDDFARRFTQLRQQHFPDWAEPSRFDHFYRLAVNTRLADAGQRMLRVGDALQIIGSTGTPAPPAVAKKRWAGALRVTEVIDHTPLVRSFRFVAAAANGASGALGAKVPFDYLPGQYITLHPQIGGQRHRRCYTLSSSPTCRDYCEVTIKRDAAGTVSRFLHDHLRPGVTMDASGPDGRFIFTGGEAEAIVLIGAGVGVTPLMSKLRYLTDTGWPGRIDFIYTARTCRDVIFRRELELLSVRYANLRIFVTLTGEMGDGGQSRRGRIDAAFLRECVPDLDRRRVHFCGPVEMAADLRGLTAALGLPPDQFHSEAFGGRRATVAPIDASATDRRPAGAVTFAGTPHSAAAYSDETVIEVADRVGVPIDHGCLAGVCGRCKLRLIAGDVRMTVMDGLSEAERADGIILACQARPLGDLVVAVD